MKDMNQTKSKVDYVLFIHLPTKDNAWKAFEEKISDVFAVLSDKGKPGLLRIFIDPGWVGLLNTIGQDFDPVKLTEDFKDLERYEKKLNTILEELANGNEDKLIELKERITLKSAKTLYPIFNSIRGNKPGSEAVKLKRYLVAEERPGIRYDTTKVVEAIIRIQHLGTGIPVLRMDWDALLNQKNSVPKLKLVISNIIYTRNYLAKNHRIYSYMISGSYDVPSWDNKLKEWDVNDFNTSFATRMFPALILTKNVITELDKPAEDKTVEATKNEDKPELKYATLKEGEFTALSEKGLFNLDIMLAYYGIPKKAKEISLIEILNEISSNEISSKGISLIGSHPLLSVISGAGLVLSDGAIMDLPPFSNFRWNVMWIDDFLKHELHKALDHFHEFIKLDYAMAGDKTEATPGRLKNSVFKDRPLGGQGNLRKYTLGGYLPTLFFGIIMDAWIRSIDGKQTPFVKILTKSLQCGSFFKEDRKRLVEELEKSAIERINFVITEWSKLQTEKDKSFAALWVGGKEYEIGEVLGTKLTQPNNDWQGWGLLNKPCKSIESIKEIRDPLRICIEELIEDMCIYIDWTLYWPNFIQSVRAEKNPLKKGS